MHDPLPVHDASPQPLRTVHLDTTTGPSGRAVRIVTPPRHRNAMADLIITFPHNGVVKESAQSMPRQALVELRDALDRILAGDMSGVAATLQATPAHGWTAQNARPALDRGPTAATLRELDELRREPGVPRGRVTP
jgi:hypothetical protein